MIENERLDELESRLLVGRKPEILAFLEIWNDTNREKKIINVYGTAGIGKSFLLDEFQRQVRMKEGISVTVDSEGFVKTPHAFCEHILSSLQQQIRYNLDSSGDPAACVQTLNELASSQRIVLFIDVYEQMESMDQWLRDFFLKKLDTSILIVISGRYPLSEAWYLSPAWRRLITRMPLSDLDYESVRRYAEYSYIFDSETIQRIWRYSNGHPLTLSLVTFILGQPELGGTSAHPGDDNTLPYLVNVWLREVPGEHMRPFVEAACVLRHFHQESLSFVMDREITASEFYQLIRYSFIRKVGRGWTVHNLMREAVNRELLSRTPQRYEETRARALQYYYQRLSGTNSKTSITQETIELMYYIGDALIRAFMNWFELSPRHFETIGKSYQEELEDYVRKRFREAKDARIELYDPHTDRHYDFSLTAEQTCFTVKLLDFNALFALGYDVVKVMREASGDIIGLAVIIPINRKTLPYLKQAPRSSAYFSHLSPSMHDRLNVPEHTRAGWFIETIDTADFGDASQQTAIGHLLHSLIFTGELIVESPAPLPYFVESHKSLGFETAAHGRHVHYDGVTEAVTFVLDLQNEHMLSYIDKMLNITGQGSMISQSENNPPGGTGKPKQSPPDTSNHDRILERNDITPREKEVAKLLEKGCTNAEMASILYLSEVTVKKHIKSMLVKLNATNRTQLLKKLLE